MKSSISVVVVARNEENSIAQVIQEACSVLPKVTGEYEILVNDDASTDRTSKILEGLRRRNHHIRVFHQPTALGIARGMEFLYNKARYEYVFILPGDGQYTIDDLPAMLKVAQRGCAIVVGKRTHKQYGLWRSIVSFFFNRLSLLFFGVDTIDAGSTKLYRKEILLKFRLLSRGVYNEAERIIRASYAGYKIGWIPAHHIVRTGGKATGAKPALIREAVADMICLWWLLRIRRVSPVTLR